MQIGRLLLTFLKELKSMNNKKNIFLTIVTENQTQKIKAEKLSELINKELDESWEILNIDKYSKFENSYKIEFKKSFTEINLEELNLRGIVFADKLASPWLIYYNKDENTIELMYNKDENSQNRKQEFNVIKWGLLQITK
jgi:hypothetical protein